MTQTSDQGIAERPQNEPPPSGKRLLVGWTTALAALGVSTALVALGVWLIRLPLAEFILGAALSERGVDADFEVVELEVDHITIAHLVVGTEESPDAAINGVEAHWRWRGLTPQLEAVRIIEPRLRLSLDAGGRVSMGSLSGLRREGRARRPRIPAIALTIEDGTALINAPFGALRASYEADGTIGEDFRAEAQIAPTTLANGDYSVDAGSASLVVSSTAGEFAWDLRASADALTWGAWALRGGALRVSGAAPLDLARVEGEAAWQAANLGGVGVAAEALSGRASLDADIREDGLAFGAWRAGGQANAAVASAANARATLLRFQTEIEGQGARGSLQWTARSGVVSGFALAARDATAGGGLRFDYEDIVAIAGEAQLRLASARLDGRAQQRLAELIPDLAGSPLAPPLAAAETALAAAASDFELTIPITIASDGRAHRLLATAPIEARARTGAVLRLSALRQDTPTLALSWPGPVMAGAVALELSGGGAPNASLLLDRVGWSAEAGLQADGTLALTNWRADGASIQAQELDVGVSVAPNGSGRVEIAGPVAATGPIGDGSVRDLVATLDLVANWDDSWRVVSNGCLPVRMGQLDVAGLSFSNGAFELCALDGALIAADARGGLSGGFSVQRLALSGRMAGPEAQPARLNAANVAGRFRGRAGDLTLALQAERPRLSIDMDDTRTLELVLARVTGDANIAETWRIAGDFSEGALSDPALPGTVTTIAGAWEAAPEDNGAPIIRVQAGEALLTANRPATEAERPLFNPLRLTGVGAIVRDGAIVAEGEVALDAGARELATFTARHEISEGLGGARVIAERISFGPSLQPYDITERARGLVDNVRGDVGAVADIAWTRDTLNSTGRVRLDGLSLATSTIPIVGDVRGELYFDDLFLLTTPPGQSVTIGLLNPGVAVRNGRTRFQLLRDQRVAIEAAAFEFASGTLAMAPTTITLGSEETRFELTLRDVDAAQLIATLGVPDLAATGLVEGSFPLLLTRRTAFIQNGIVRAQEGGGTIAYTGNAGQGATGPARIAFDALRSFRYDDLTLTLDGDLNGEVISAIAFSGENTGEDVELGDIAPIPGVGDITMRGVPFRFNVTISAPFRALAQTAASITDPASLLNRQGSAESEESAPQEPERVDPPPASQ
jgi:hypothetical protein